MGNIWCDAIKWVLKRQLFGHLCGKAFLTQPGRINDSLNDTRVKRWVYLVTFTKLFRYLQFIFIGCQRSIRGMVAICQQVWNFVIA